MKDQGTLLVWPYFDPHLWHCFFNGNRNPHQQTERGSICDRFNRNFLLLLYEKAWSKVHRLLQRFLFKPLPPQLVLTISAPSFVTLLTAEVFDAGKVQYCSLPTSSEQFGHSCKISTSSSVVTEIILSFQFFFELYHFTVVTYGSSFSSRRFMHWYIVQSDAS